jgi:hypothetical protein
VMVEPQIVHVMMMIVQVFASLFQMAVSCCWLKSSAVLEDATV